MKKATEKEWLTMQDIVRDRMFPWATSVWSVRNIVIKDFFGKNTLKTTITGEGRAKKYLFTRRNIINFVKQVEAGKVSL